jgi:hypothetical protein
VAITKPSYFKTSISNSEVMPKGKIKEDFLIFVPTQMNRAVEFVEKVKDLVVGTMGLSLAISVALSQSIQPILSILKVHQVATHMAIINVPNLPSAAVKFQNMLIGLNQRDMYSIDTLYK